MTDIGIVLGALFGVFALALLTLALHYVANDRRTPTPTVTRLELAPSPAKGHTEIQNGVNGVNGHGVNGVNGHSNGVAVESSQV